MESLKLSLFAFLCGLVVGCGGKGESTDDDAGTGGAGSVGEVADGGSFSGTGGEAGGTGGIDATGTGGSESGGTANGGDGTGGVDGSTSGDEEAADFSVDVISFVFDLDQVMRPFSPPIGGFAESECERTEVGDCVARVCPVDEPAAVGEQYRHAGEVTAEMNAADQTISAVSSPAASGKYPISSFSPYAPLRGEETGVVSAAGGDIGAFSRNVAFPLLLLSTNEVVPSSLIGYDIEVSRGGDFTLTWDRGAPGVSYLIQRNIQSDERYRLNCTFDSTSGSGVIPAQLLALMPTGTRLDAFTSATQEFNVADDLIRIRVATEVTVPAKDGPVHLVLVD